MLYIRSWLLSFHELLIYMYIRDRHKVFTDRANVRLVLRPLVRMIGSQRPLRKVIEDSSIGEQIRSSYTFQLMDPWLPRVNKMISSAKAHK